MEAAITAQDDGSLISSRLQVEEKINSTVHTGYLCVTPVGDTYMCHY